jgi:hypothetical protein
MASIRTAGLTTDVGDLRAVNAIDLDLPDGGVAVLAGTRVLIAAARHPGRIHLIDARSGTGAMVAPAAYH